jgi:hypothetical protein
MTTRAAPRVRIRLTDPRLVDLPDRRMAVARTVGDPNVVGAGAISALYGAVFGLKFARKKEGHDFKVEPLRARWEAGFEQLDARRMAARDQWRGLWALPVPEDTATDDLPQKNPDVPVAVETWEYGTVAQILHLGPYSTETETIRRLHDFIAAEGYEIAGPHEEEYLTRPTAKTPKTIIRYRVRKRM